MAGEVPGRLELQASRLRSRTNAAGEPVLLLDQDRSRWDQLLIRRGLAALARAGSIGEAAGPYRLQAEIAACHARASAPGKTDWIRIAALYEALVRLTSSPVVELNRAVAVAMAFGPASGLAIADHLAGQPALSGYHLLPAVRGDLLERLDRRDEAAGEFARAASLASNRQEQAVLRRRADNLSRGETGA